MSTGTAAASRPRPTSAATTNGLVVMGAGFGRTGTSSLQEALEILGLGPCYHMREVFKDPQGVSKWIQVGISAQNADWDAIFWGYSAVVDCPASLYYQELLEHYPKAKVILSVRDEESWVKSVLTTIAPAPPLWKFLYRLSGTANPRFDTMARLTVWEPFVGGVDKARDREALLQAFRRHNQQVMDHVPKEQLLVWNVKDGWGPLCKFLNVPEPEDTPFPRSWDSANFQAAIKAKKRRTVNRLVMRAMGAMLLVTAVVMFQRGSRASTR